MRLITKETTDGNLISATEEALISMVINGEAEEFIWIWKHPKGIYMPNTTSINFVGVEFAKQNGYPINRSSLFSGGRASVIVTGYDFGICAAIKKSEIISSYSDFKNKVINEASCYLASELGIIAENKLDTNDIVINSTDKKLAGSICGQRDDIFITNQAYSISLPPEDFNSFFNLPIEKFADKTVKSPAERVTSLESESGRIVSMETIISILKDYYISLGISFSVINDFTEEEYAKIESLKSKHLNENWIKYGRITAKPDFE